ncbi:MAG: hypothetical protein E7676_03690 [Ruminococcaceae bacterium]|nr:hypothetical protein [Oscillospiraceae bacterium]
MENNFDKENEQIAAQNDANEALAEGNEVHTSNESLNIPAVAKKPFPFWIVAVAVVILASVITLVVLLIPKIADYTVTVVDEIGNPVSNVMVKLTDASGDIKTRVTDKSGKAFFNETKVNKIGKSNVVKLDKGLSNVKILTAEYELDKKTTNLRAVVCNEDNILSISGQISDGAYAYNASQGTYNIPSLDDTVYMCFMANERGIYKVSIQSDDRDASVAYVGMPMYVQTTHVGDGEYDGKSFDLVIQDIKTPYVIAVSANGSADVAFSIERIGDAPLDPQYMPWTSVQATEDFIEVNTTILTPLDIASAALSVELREDGYYYSSGKLVYVRIGSSSNYLDASLALMAGCVDKNVGINIGGYVYDGDTFVGKYSYNDMIAAYYEHCDSNGVYPLTEELAEAIKLHGKSAGWWNPTSPDFLFNGKPYKEENAWLFLCCTSN